MREGRGLQAHAPGPVSGPTDGELLRLQAENSALQKKLAGELSEIRTSYTPCPYAICVLKIFISLFFIQLFCERNSTELNLIRNDAYQSVFPLY